MNLVGFVTTVIGQVVISESRLEKAVQLPPSLLGTLSLSHLDPSLQAERSSSNMENNLQVLCLIALVELVFKSSQPRHQTRA